MTLTMMWKSKTVDRAGDDTDAAFCTSVRENVFLAWLRIELRPGANGYDCCVCIHRGFDEFGQLASVDIVAATAYQKVGKEYGAARCSVSIADEIGRSRLR